MIIAEVLQERSRKMQRKTCEVATPSIQFFPRVSRYSAIDWKTIFEKAKLLSSQMQNTPLLKHEYWKHFELHTKRTQQKLFNEELGSKLHRTWTWRKMMNRKLFDFLKSFYQRAMQKYRLKNHFWKGSESDLLSSQCKTLRQQGSR